MDLPLGHSGLTQGQPIVFRYDFGDNHQFNVVVAAIHPKQAPRTKYPRIVTRPVKLPSSTHATACANEPNLMSGSRVAGPFAFA